MKISIDSGQRLWLEAYDKSPGTLCIIERDAGKLYLVPFAELLQHPASDRGTVEQVHKIINDMVWLARGEDQCLEGLLEALQPYEA